MLINIKDTVSLALNYDSAERVILDKEDCTEQVLAFIKKRLETQLAKADWRALDSLPSSKGDDTHHQFCVAITLFNPILDVESIVDAVNACVQSDHAEVKPVGFIKGTEFTSLYLAGYEAHSKTPVLLSSNLMNTFKTTFDLRKQKRLKVFLKSMMNDDRFIHQSAEDIAKFFCTDEGVRLVLGYGEAVTLVKSTHCPNCNSTNLRYIYPDVGWPRIGFLTCQSPYHSQCSDCSMIFLNPGYSYDESGKFYDGIDNECGHITNEVTQEPYYNNFLEARREIAARFDDKPSVEFIDIGSGSGNFSYMLREQFKQAKINALDFKEPENITRLEEVNVKFTVGDLFSNVEKFEDGSISVISAFEVIEHIPFDKFKGLLSICKRKLTKEGILVFSTPDKASIDTNLTDFWVAYAPQHVTVFNRALLADILSQHGFSVAKTTWCSYPFGHNSIEIDYYKDCYKDINESLYSQLSLLEKLNDARDKSKHKCLSGERDGAELILIAENNE